MGFQLFLPSNSQFKIIPVLQVLFLTTAATLPLEVQSGPFFVSNLLRGTLGRTKGRREYGRAHPGAGGPAERPAGRPAAPPAAPSKLNIRNKQISGRENITILCVCSN